MLAFFLLISKIIYTTTQSTNPDTKADRQVLICFPEDQGLQWIRLLGSYPFLKDTAVLQLNWNTEWHFLSRPWGFVGEELKFSPFKGQVFFLFFFRKSNWGWKGFASTVKQIFLKLFFNYPSQLLSIPSPWKPCIQPPTPSSYKYIETQVHVYGLSWLFIYTQMDSFYAHYFTFTYHFYFCNTHITFTSFIYIVAITLDPDIGWIHSY